MLAEVIEDQFSINATLPRTLHALFFKPGFLSSEYINGRIASYVPPFRLYLVASVLFFLLLSFVSGRSSRGIVNISGDAGVDTTRSVVEMLEEFDSAGQVADPARQLRAFRTGWERLDTLGNRRLLELAELQPNEAARVLSSAMLQRAPTAVFLMLPCYALLLQLLYFRRRKYYVEHFVFGLHTHAFAFVLFTIMLVGGRIPWIGGPLMIWLVVYGYIALKRFYRQGWFTSLVKYGLLGLLYSIVFVAGVSLTVMAALLLG